MPGATGRNRGASAVATVASAAPITTTTESRHKTSVARRIVATIFARRHRPTPNGSSLGPPPGLRRYPAPTPHAMEARDDQGESVSRRIADAAGARARCTHHRACAAEWDDVLHYQRRLGKRCGP